MRLDWISIIIVGIMICATIVLCFYYYAVIKDECISNPFVYGASIYSEKYGKEMVGSAYFLMENSPIIVFDAYNSSIQ